MFPSPPNWIGKTNKISALDKDGQDRAGYYFFMHLDHVNSDPNTKSFDKLAGWYAVE